MYRYMKFLDKLKFLIFLLLSSDFIIKPCLAHLVQSKHFELLSPNNLLQNLQSTCLKNFQNCTCGSDLQIYVQAIEQQKLWALKMLNSSSNIPSGILDGHLIDLGMYDECLAIRQTISDHDINGRHCVYSLNAKFNQNLSLPLTLSICVPDTCQASDINFFINDAIHIMNLKNFAVDVTSVTCSSPDQDVWSLDFMILFYILVGFIGFLICCTVYDVKLKNENGKSNIFKQLSLRHTAKEIFNTKIKEDNIPVIHGLKVFSTAWIVLGHQFVLEFYDATIDQKYIMEWIQSWKSLYIFTAPFAVDTFFTASGFLMTYIFLKQISKQTKFNIPMYYIHRYIRLTPSLLVLVLISIIIVPKIGNGPRWDTEINYLIGSCRSKWWSIPLYMHNFVETENTCMVHLWYLAVEMQLFWISPIILYPLYKTPKIGLTVTTLLLSFCIIITALIVGINRYPMLSYTQSANPRLFLIAFQEVYEKPYTRAGPWLCGILLANEVVTNKRKPSKITICIGWLLAVSAFAFCIFGTRYFIDPNYEYNVIFETIFATVSRPIWGYGICWIIYASIKGFAGPVSRILSWRGFLPFSKLSYCIYLVHLVIQSVNFASLRSADFSESLIWDKYFSGLILHIVIAFFFSLFFESPFLILEKYFLKGK